MYSKEDGPRMAQLHVLSAREAMDLLDAAGVAYDVREQAAEGFTCEDVARLRGLPVERIVKCMVGATAGRAWWLMLVPGTERVNLAKVSRLVGTKVRLVSPDILRTDFGVTLGAISPVQWREAADGFLMDAKLRNAGVVSISSGDASRGLTLDVADLAGFLGAHWADITA